MFYVYDINSSFIWGGTTFIKLENIPFFKLKDPIFQKTLFHPCSPKSIALNVCKSNEMHLWFQNYLSKEKCEAKKVVFNVLRFSKEISVGILIKT